MRQWSRERRGAAPGLTADDRRPLSIAMMIESVNLGGAEMVVLQLAQELKSRGHTVHGVVPAGREGWLTEELRANGFGCHGYDLRRPIDWSFPPRLASQLHEMGVDVIHSHEFVMAVYGAAAAHRLGLRHVVTMHGNQGMTEKFQRRVALRWAFRNSDHVVAVSNDTRRHLVSSLGVRKDAIDVIHNGIPERPGQRAETRQQLGVSDSEVLMLSVGNLIPRKGHALLLQSLTLLASHGVNTPWRLVIAGAGPEQAALEAQIAALGLGDRVQLLGRRTDVPDLQAAADVFVLPSLWEGLPLAILEAFFAGNAVVATNMSGIPEAIDDGTHGVLVPPGDVPALAAGLAAVLRDPAYRNRLGAAGRERAHRQFTIGVMTSAYERMYGRAGVVATPVLAAV